MTPPPNSPVRYPGIMDDSMVLQIGGISVGIDGYTSSDHFPEGYRAFLACADEDMRLSLREGPPSARVGTKCFYAEPIWSFQRSEDTAITEIFSDPRFPDQARTLAFSHSLRKAELCFHHDSGILSDPFYGPTLELLIAQYLAQGEGIIVHACGINQRGRGILFPAHSGTGKTTLAKEWHKKGGMIILSDDRVVIRKDDDRFWIYGTPWHGEAGFAFAGKAPLERVFFLEQGKQNTVKSFSGAQAVSKLLTCSFPPHWDAEGMKSTLDFVADVAANVQCHELSFVPGSGVIDFVQGFCDEMP
jgi:hypothetical protein